MNWQQFIPMAVVLGVAVVFVWRSSSKKHDHDHDCNCGCSHEPTGNDQKEKAGH